MGINVIKPSAVADGEAQNISADLTKFDKAKEQVGLTVTELEKYNIIVSKETCDDAIIVLKHANEINKALENKRKDLVKPFNESVSKINTYAKELTGKITGAIDAVKKAALSYQDAEEKKSLKIKEEKRTLQLESMGFYYDEVKECFTGNDFTISKMDLKLPDNIWNDRIDYFTKQFVEKAKHELEKHEDVADLVDAFGDEDDKTALLQTKVQQVKTLEASLADNNHSIVAMPEKLKGSTMRWVFDVTDTTLIPREFLVVDETAIRKAITAGARSIPGVNIRQEKSLSIR